MVPVWIPVELSIVYSSILGGGTEVFAGILFVVDHLLNGIPAVAVEVHIAIVVAKPTFVDGMCALLIFGSLHVFAYWVLICPDVLVAVNFMV